MCFRFVQASVAAEDSVPDVVAGVVDGVVALGSLRMISRAAMSSVETGRMGLPAMLSLIHISEPTRP